MGTTRRRKRFFVNLDIAMPLTIALVFVILIMGLLIKYAAMPIEKKWYTLNYQGQVVRCLVEFPHYADGKMSRWSGTVNLKQCEDGKDYLGATNVQVLKYPECGCGG